MKTVTAQEIELQVAKYFEVLRVPRLFAGRADLRVCLLPHLDGFEVRVMQAIAAQQLDVITVSYPASWWEAFKERWFFKFLLNYFPVRRTYKRLEAKALYPHIALPDQQRHIVLSVTDLGDMDG